MLSHLEVDNLALIKNCSLDFYPGLTCISGETGAGKSLLLTAVKAITGSRLSSDLLGRKDKELKVSAQFTQVERYLPPEILQEFCGADPAAGHGQGYGHGDGYSGSFDDCKRFCGCGFNYYPKIERRYAESNLY